MTELDVSLAVALVAAGAPDDVDTLEVIARAVDVGEDGDVKAAVSALRDELPGAFPRYPRSAPPPPPAHLRSVRT